MKLDAIKICGLSVLSCLAKGLDDTRNLRSF